MAKTYLKKLEKRLEKSNTYKQVETLFEYMMNPVHKGAGITIERIRAILEEKNSPLLEHVAILTDEEAWKKDTSENFERVLEEISAQDTWLKRVLSFDKQAPKGDSLKSMKALWNKDRLDPTILRALDYDKASIKFIRSIADGNGTFEKHMEDPAMNEKYNLKDLEQFLHYRGDALNVGESEDRAVYKHFLSESEANTMIKFMGSYGDLYRSLSVFLFNGEKDLFLKAINSTPEFKQEAKHLRKFLLKSGNSKVDKAKAKNMSYTELETLYEEIFNTKEEGIILKKDGRARTK